ncbi:hypothetical protein TTHERM_00637160 (macronuclear) [Tetrahymena thermophila SB210]|uniref:C1q domain-containing protein n=1 Tax=Tetrahymena thermophila (strain SB210) TaxID=312017 RepID=Q22HI7_TETTS|nr:hypothetical protein TTHERM_00637160 [Tetrahymena thermophila SB210]EAR84714.1 hypothetical protein TTHERM_00637160 [Tetrahymena thermophila SB210]|eukprot:XP_001032377.1 hypothetical protein TTHERM_00637160 [Tetrahymena thermophila SB210]
MSYKLNNSNTFSPLRANKSIPSLGGGINIRDTDAYSTMIVEDLLQGANEWRNIQDIIRLTLRALTDVVKAQSDTIREIERQLPTKASKSEMNTQLAQKANITEVSRTIAEIAQGIDNKICYDDLQLMLKDFVSKNDLQYQLSSKVNIEEVRSLLQTKASNMDLKQELQLLNVKFEELQREFAKKAATNVQHKDIEYVISQLELKANVQDVNEALETKANKASVSNALHRKANKVDIENQYAKKQDIANIGNLLNNMDEKAEYSSIEKIMQILNNKVDKSDFAQLCNTLDQQGGDPKEVQLLKNEFSSFKSNFSQIDRQLGLDKIRADINGLDQTIQALIQNNLGGVQSDKVLLSLEKKCDVSQAFDLVNKAKNDFQDSLIKIQDEQSKSQQIFTDKYFKILESVKDEIINLKDQLNHSNEERYQTEQQLTDYIKQQSELVQSDLMQEIDKVYNELDEVRKQIDDVSSLKIDKKEHGEFKSKVMGILEDKVDLSEVQQALNVCQADISARFVEYKEEMKLKLKNVEGDILNAVSKKANLQDIQDILNSKVDASMVQQIISKRANSKEVEALRVIVDKISVDIEEKLTVNDFENHVLQTKNALDAIQKDMILKANIKDVCALLDTKANIDDMNKALTEIYKDLDSKSSQEDLNIIINDQAIINESLCTENIVGRWTWKSQNLKQGNLVPWESQVVNTLPDNFQWEKDKSYIMCVTPGLYQVSFGFFCSKKPSIQLLVNGELAISTLGNEGHTVNQKFINYGNHPSGNITGMTLNEFLVLPERARISIIYEGDFGAEGFLGLKRL